MSERGYHVPEPDLLPLAGVASWIDPPRPRQVALATRNTKEGDLCQLTSRPRFLPITEVDIYHRSVSRIPIFQSLPQQIAEGAAGGSVDSGQGLRGSGLPRMQQGGREASEDCLPLVD
jgi:hypothetical protein